MSSGPLDDVRRRGRDPTREARCDGMSNIGARGQVTFGGRLEPTAKGFPARAMAK